MARPLRIEYAGAIYHVMNRGDRREAVFKDDTDRETFLRTLGEACGKTGWEVQAWCLMGEPFSFGNRNAEGEPGCRDEMDAGHLHPAFQPAAQALRPSFSRPLQGADGRRGE